MRRTAAAVEDKTKGVGILLIVAFMVAAAGYFSYLQSRAANASDDSIGLSSVILLAPPPAAPVMTCHRPQSPEEDELVDALEAVLRSNRAPAVYLSLSTKDTLPALAMQIESIKEFAPQTLAQFVVVCVGDDTCSECSRLRAAADSPGNCVPDKHLANFLQGVTGADSLSQGAGHKPGTAGGAFGKSGGVAKAYVDIIWRKPELILLAFQAGFGQVGIVDTDGVWFGPPPASGDASSPSVMASSEFAEQNDYFVTQQACRSSPMHRGSPLKLNSGTVIIRNDAVGRALLRDWIDFRATKPSGLCASTEQSGEMTTTATLRKDDVMLDQDGLNSVACLTDRPYSGQVRGLSSHSVLLNSVHSQLRHQAWFSICHAWFFHSTNCGGTAMKPECMQKNLQRRREAMCE